MNLPAISSSYGARLYPLNGYRVCEYLLKRLSDENDSFIRSDIIQIVSSIKCPGCEENLVPLLNDPDWRVRYFTIDALGKLGYKMLAACLPEIILNDPNQEVKIGAIMSLGEYGKEKDIPFLEDLLARREYQKKVLSIINVALANLRSNLSNEK